MAEESQLPKVKALNEAEIESMSVLKDEWAVERYGEAAADGVVYVTTTAGAGSSAVWSVVFQHGNSFQEGPGFYRIKNTGNGFASVRSMEPDRLC